MALHSATTVLSTRSPQEKSQTPIIDRSFFEIVAPWETRKVSTTSRISQLKKKDKHLFTLGDGPGPTSNKEAPIPHYGAKRRRDRNRPATSLQPDWRVMERVALDQVDQSKKNIAQAQRSGMDENQHSASCNYRQRAGPQIGRSWQIDWDTRSVRPSQGYSTHSHEEPQIGQLQIVRKRF